MLVPGTFFEKAMEMKVLATGVYDPGYNRNRVLVSGLRKVGVEVVEYPYALRRTADTETLRSFARDVHLVYLPPFTHADVSFVKKLVDKPLVFDLLISKCLTKVHDYRAVWKYSPRGMKNYLKDKLPLNVADFVLCDTEHHKEYFFEMFKVPLEKMAVLPVALWRMTSNQSVCVVGTEFSEWDFMEVSCLCRESEKLWRRQGS